MEIWKTITNYSNYEVSSFGNVRSIHRIIIDANGITRKYKQKTLIGRPTGNSRLAVTLCKDGTKKNFSIHRLVCTEFNGPCPDGMECRHLDGNYLNNNYTNLEWGTHLQNMHDKIAHGTVSCGESHGKAKLSAAQVKEARIRYASGESQTALAREYGVNQSAISRAINKKRWSHI